MHRIVAGGVGGAAHVYGFKERGRGTYLASVLRAQHSFDTVRKHVVCDFSEVGLVQSVCVSSVLALALTHSVIAARRARTHTSYMHIHTIQLLTH